MTFFPLRHWRPLHNTPGFLSACGRGHDPTLTGTARCSTYVCSCLTHRASQGQTSLFFPTVSDEGKNFIPSAHIDHKSVFTQKRRKNWFSTKFISYSLAFLYFALLFKFLGGHLLEFLKVRLPHLKSYHELAVMLVLSKWGSYLKKLFECPSNFGHYF
jgi:hypothetical protein